MYVFGCEGHQYAQAFNIITETWEESTPMPVCYDNWQGTVAEGSLYLVGGYAPYINNVQKFTPIGGGPAGIWEQKAPYPREGCGIATA